MRRAAIGGIVGALALAGCAGESPTDPGPDPAQAGWLTVEFVAAAGDVGGVLFTFSGGPIDSIRGNAGLQAFARAATDASWQVMLIGRPLPAGAIGAIHVPDVARAAEYQATITQVAGRGAHEQRDPAGYAIRLAP
jgi:hypothetical protein